MPAKRSSVHIMTVAFALLLVSCDRTPNPKNLAIVGELTVYTHFPANQLTTNLAVFKAKYPDIEVKVVADTSRRLAKRVLQEQHDPQADVIWGMLVPDLIRLEWHNLLSPYTPAGIERMRLSFRDTGTPPFWVGLSAWMSAFCVNTAQLKATGLPPPQGWSDLVDPIYKGRLAMPDPTRTHTGYMTVATVLQLYGETKGWK
ncbi:MAG: extracellular solute-binding protein, partial [Candidatus Tectomicrobia bacterium]|nr:extracellular solute-binding protein [Candidatus Tectomicrobia bacterium]